MVCPSQYSRNLAEFANESGEWMVTISSFMDESGKFLDSDVVVIGAVVAHGPPGTASFVNEWAYWLHQTGLQYLEMKTASRLIFPLSEKVPAHEPYRRIDALLPFVLCVRRHLQMISGVAIDVREFRSLPEQYRKIWSDDPCYTAFARNVLAIIEDSPSDGILSLYCDDEEKTAWPFYELYRRIKNQYPDARGKLKGITFADDQLSFAIQAADLVSSLIRQEALLRFRNQPYNFQPLFDALFKYPDPWEMVLKAGVAWCDKEQLSRLGENYKTAKRDQTVVQLADLTK